MRATLLLLVVPRASRKYIKQMFDWIGFDLEAVGLLCVRTAETNEHAQIRSQTVTQSKRRHESAKWRQPTFHHQPCCQGKQGQARFASQTIG